MEAYIITKRFTGGLLKGLTYTETLYRCSIAPRVGFVVANPIGGSPYVIEKVEILKTPVDKK